MTAKSVRSIFLEAVEGLPESEWTAYLDVACGDDANLRGQVEKLLRVHRQMGTFHDDVPPLVTATAGVAMADAAVGTQIGLYKLRELLAEGGMGVVYVAEQSEPVKRQVALKIVKSGLATKDVAARFEAERQALAMMNHPNIARVFDGGVTDTGQSFFVMELVPGLPITEYCDQKRLSTRERLELFVTVCQAVHHAHQKGIIHRDLKPTNVLVAEIDGKAVAKVIDFGVAKATGDKLTQQTVYTHFAQMVGTPLYMSPEQASLGGTDVDTRSDVYSLGVLLYELLTSKTPFDSETLKEAGFDEMRRIIRQVEPSRPSTLVSTLDAQRQSTAARCRGIDARQLTSLLRGELDWLVMKSLEKDRNRRYGSAIALAEDVDRFLANQPISAGPPSTVYRFKKFVQRNQARLIPASVVAIVLLIGLTTSLVALLQERAAKQSLQDETARRLYASQMVRAVAAWEDHDFGTLKDLLASTTPPTSESPDFRDWEWHFLSEQVRRLFVSVPDKRVYAAAWHPRRNELAVVVETSENDSAIEIWKPGDQAPLRTVANLPGVTARWIPDAVWAADGKRIAVTTNRGRAVVFDAEKGTVVFDQQVYQGERNKIAVWGVALSPAGDLLATGNRFGQIKIWGLEAGQLVEAFPEPTKTRGLNYLAFSPDGAHLAATFVSDKRVVVWNVKTGDRFDYVPVWGQGKLAWHSDGKRFVAACENKVAVYQLAVAKPLFVFEHREVLDVCWIDDHLFASCGADQKIRIWDLHKGEVVRSLRVGRFQLDNVDISSDGQTLVTWEWKRPESLNVIGLGNQFGYDVLQPANAKARESVLRWSRDGNRIAVNNLSCLYIYDVRTSRIVTTHDEVHDHGGELMFWSVDDASIIAYDYDCRRHEYSATDSRSRRVDNSLYGIKNVYRDLALNQQLGLLAVGIDHEEIRIYRLEDLQIEDRLPHTVHGTNTGLAWSPDNQLLLCLSNYGDEQVRIYDVRRRETRTLYPFDTKATRSDPTVAWDPASTQVAISRSEPAIHVFSVASGKLRATLVGPSAPIHEISWSPSGTRIAACAGDGTVHLWDANRADHLAVFNPPEESTLFHSVQWSPDGRRLAASGSRGEVYLLDAGNSMPVPEGSVAKVAPYGKNNPRWLAEEIALQKAASPEILIDDFSEESDDGWTRHDANARHPGGPGNHDASSGAYRLTTSGQVPAGLPTVSYIAATWDNSADPVFSNGLVRAKVRVDSRGSFASIGHRISGSLNTGFSGYLFGGDHAGFQFVKLENDRVADAFLVGSGLKLGVGEDWWIEAGGVGDRLSMKVWRVGTAEPPLPQLTVVDSTFTSGRIAVESNVAVPQPAQVNATFDDIYFTPISEAPDASHR